MFSLCLGAPFVSEFRFDFKIFFFFFFKSNLNSQNDFGRVLYFRMTTSLKVDNQVSRLESTTQLFKDELRGAGT